MRTSLEVGQGLKMGQACEVARSGVGIGTRVGSERGDGRGTGTEKRQGL